MYLFYYMCSVLLHIKDKIYSSTVLIKIFSFSQSIWILVEKTPETFNIKNRIELLFLVLHCSVFTDTAYSSLVYNEVFLDFNVFLINVLRISLLFFNLSYYLTRIFSPPLKILSVLLRLILVQNSSEINTWKIIFPKKLNH